MAFMWMPLNTHHPSKRCCGPSKAPHHKRSTWWQWPPSRTMFPDTPQVLLRNSSRNTIKGPRSRVGLQIPQTPIWSSICKTCWAGLIHGGLIPQHTGPRGSTIKHPGARHHRTSSEVLRGPNTARLKPTASCPYPSPPLPLAWPIQQKSCIEIYCLDYFQLHCSVYVLCLCKMQQVSSTSGGASLVPAIQNIKTGNDGTRADHRHFHPSYTSRQLANTVRMVIGQLAHNQSEYPKAFNPQTANALSLCKLNLTRHHPRGSKSFQHSWTHRTDLFPNSSKSPQTFQMSNVWASVFLPLSPCLDRSELFWLHKGNLHNIRQVLFLHKTTDKHYILYSQRTHLNVKEVERKKLTTALRLPTVWYTLLIPLEETFIWLQHAVDQT